MTYNLGQEIFNRILTSAENKRIPLWSHLDLTYRCNLQCIHCYCRNLSVAPWINQPELTLSEIKSLLDELADVGSLYLTLSGGEVLLREDFFEITSYARSKNFCVTLFTNGTLINEEVAKRLADLSLLSVEMSIYGSTKEVHDSITGKKGSFERLLSAVSLLKKYEVRFTLKTVLMKSNFHQAQEIAKLSLRLGARDFRVNVEISPKNDGSRQPQQEQISEEQIYSFFENFPAGQTQKNPHWDNPLEKPLCGTGAIGCYISPYGDVYPCIQLLIPMGNLREKKFSAIWFAPSLLLRELDRLKTYRDLGLCRTCKYVSACRKCIGLAHLETKDMRKCYGRIKAISKTEFEFCEGRLYAKEKEAVS